MGRWGRSKDLPLVYDFFSKNLDQLPRRVKVEDAPDVGVRANLRYVAGEVLPRNEVLGSYAIAFSTPGRWKLSIRSYNPSRRTKRCACWIFY